MRSNKKQLIAQIMLLTIPVLGLGAVSVFLGATFGWIAVLKGLALVAVAIVYTLTVFMLLR